MANLLRGELLLRPQSVGLRGLEGDSMLLSSRWQIENFLVSKGRKASSEHPPISNVQCTCTGRGGYCWPMGKKLIVSDGRSENEKWTYWHVAQKPNGIAYVVINYHELQRGIVVSDQFGGCEWHVIYNSRYPLVGFLHVYRGGKRPALRYRLKEGWRRLERKESKWLSADNKKVFGKIGNIAAVSEFWCSQDWTRPHVESKFFEMDYRGGVLTLRNEDDGTPITA